MVLIASGSSARQTLATDKRPVDAVVMAIVDSWSLGGDAKYKK
jgi:ethanolamine utilization protein EutN/carbon dioxide concentrating mechanism protein CcmL